MNAALLTVLMAAAGTALLAIVGFRLGLSVDRRFKDKVEVVKAVQAYSGLQSEFDVLISHNQRAAVAYGTDKTGYVVTVLGDKFLVRSLDQAKIMSSQMIACISLFLILALSPSMYKPMPMKYRKR